MQEKNEHFIKLLLNTFKNNDFIPKFFTVKQSSSTFLLKFKL